MRGRSVDDAEAAKFKPTPADVAAARLAAAWYGLPAPERAPLRCFCSRAERACA